MFDIMPVELSDEELDDFGERDYILYRIERELNVQFNTRKQLLLAEKEGFARLRAGPVAALAVSALRYPKNRSGAR